MHIAYVDEGYDAYHYRLAAMLVEPDQVNPLSQTLYELAGTLAAKHGIHAEEFHAYEIHAGEGPWDGVPLRLRIWAFTKILEAVRAAGVKIALVGLDRPNPRRRGWPTDAHVHLMGQLFSQLDHFCGQCGDHVIIVADEHDATAATSRELVRNMQLSRGASPTRHLRVIDTVHFVRSHESRPVQAADLLAYLFRRDAAGLDTDPRAKKVMERHLAIVSPLIIAHHLAATPDPWC